MTNVARMSTLIGIARAAIGVGYMIAPTRSHTTLAGRDAALPTTRAASRTFGIREIYVGGSVVAAQHGRHAQSSRCSSPVWPLMRGTLRHSR